MRFARFALGFLLVGYLLFNKPFALLGAGPVYVGEIVLAIVLFVSLLNFKTFWLEPLKHAWLPRLTLAFLIYGTIRVLVDVVAQYKNGLPASILAARDGVCVGYAIFALLAPPLLGEGLATLLVCIAPLAAVWAACFERGVWPATLQELRTDTKPDMLSLSVVVAAWVLGVKAWQHLRKPQPQSGGAPAAPITRKEAGRTRGVTFSAAALVTAVLAFSMHTRAAWLASVVLIVFILALNARRLCNRYALAAAIIFAALVWFVAIPYVENCPEPWAERIRGTFCVDAFTLQTQDARVAELNVVWRTTFWKQCIAETCNRAPWFGLGFGMNLTDLMRGTEHWWRYEESQRMSPPNRNPHCAAITILTRTGFTGFTLFAALLLWTAVNGFRRCHGTPSSEKYILLFGVWLIYIAYMSVGDVIENPFGGIWFWVLTGVIGRPIIAP